jgi:hypothetical protein
MKILSEWCCSKARLLGTSIALMALASSAATSQTATPPACPGDLGSWIKWRDDQIALVLAPTAAAPSGEKVINPDDLHATALRSFSFLDSCIRANPPAFAKGSAIMASLDAFHGFVSAVGLMAITENGKTTHQLGLKISDRDYVEYSKPFLQFPARMMQQDFLKAMDSPGGYQAAMKMIDDRNNDAADKNNQWIALPFRAQFITTIDTLHRTYGRLLVFVPNEPAPDGGRLDKWVLWGIVTPDMDQATEMHNVSIFAVHTDTSGLHRTTYFGDFWRTRNADGTIDVSSSFLRELDPSGNCYQCHKSSILPFHPKAEYKFGLDGKLVEKSAGDQLLGPALNGIVGSYGPPDFGPMPLPNADANNRLMDVLNYGPPLGPADRVRSDAFITACVPGSTPSSDSIQNVRNAMQCDGCHTADPSGLGRLNYLLAVRSIRDVTKTFERMESPIATFVKEGWMPPGNHLTPAERSTLAACALKEYYDNQTTSGIFVDWLAAKK